MGVRGSRFASSSLEPALCANHSTSAARILLEAEGLVPVSEPSLGRDEFRNCGGLVLRREIDPGKVFDLELPLADVAEGYRAMDERRAIKGLLRV